MEVRLGAMSDRPQNVTLGRIEMREVGGRTGAPASEVAKQVLTAIAEEVADTVIYADLLAARLGIALEEAVIAKFNEVSIRNGFPQRLK